MSVAKILATKVEAGASMLGRTEEQRAKVDENTGNTPEAGQDSGRLEKTLPVEKVADPTME